MIKAVTISGCGANAWIRVTMGVSTKLVAASCQCRTDLYPVLGLGPKW